MSDDALYVSVYKQLAEDIRNGEYGENMPLPTETELCKKYHVSRATIRQSLAMLKNTDTIFSVQGAGTYIKPQVFVQPLSQLYSFTDTLKSSNVIICNSIVDYSLIKADKSLSRDTQYPVGTVFHKLVRLRSARDYPLMIETTYLPQNRFNKLDLDVLASGSLYEFLRSRYGFHVDKATETFRPVMPRPDEMGLLCISASMPCILLQRFSYEDGILAEYTKSIVRGDKYEFRVDLY